MTAETAYERIVSRLEAEYDSAIRRAARDGLALAAREGMATDRDYRRDCAVDAAEKFMFDNEAFELVKATDISDIACEIADEVERDNWVAGNG